MNVAAVQIGVDIAISDTSFKKKKKKKAEELKTANAESQRNRNISKMDRFYLCSAKAHEAQTRTVHTMDRGIYAELIYMIHMW